MTVKHSIWRTNVYIKLFCEGILGIVAFCKYYSSPENSTFVWSILIKLPYFTASPSRPTDAYQEKNSTVYYNFSSSIHSYLRRWHINALLTYQHHHRPQLTLPLTRRNRRTHHRWQKLSDICKASISNKPLVSTDHLIHNLPPCAIVGFLLD